MKHNDKVIFDSGFGFSIGYYQDVPGPYATVAVLIDGSIGAYYEGSVLPYTEDLHMKMIAKYY